MSKQSTLLIAALRAVVKACANGASASATICLAICQAILAGADVRDIIDAARDGYLQHGQTMPQGMASNIRRLAAAPGELVQQVGEYGCALNNSLLTHFNVPKLTARGAKVKAKVEAKTADKPAANDAEFVPTTMAQYMLALRGMSARVNTIGLTATDASAVQNALQDALARITQATKTKA